ncbi:MAG TPA: STAS domain-containing protein [Pseudonocardiaceae bacterium]|jgi:anti-sigma B factor antagonist|nr:STAS domain-containing protein [Pseudonocardiaceae bacterium]
MKVSRRLIDDVAVVALSGALDSRSTAEVQDRLVQLLPQHDCVVVDLSRVTCVSSASLRMLVLIYRQARGLGHTVAVVGLSPEVHNVLDATGFLDFFIVSDTVADGVANVLNRVEGRLEDERAVARA